MDYIRDNFINRIFKVITGYSFDDYWVDIDRKLWSFKINSFEEVSSPKSEIFGSGECVKALEITHNKNIEYLPVKVYEKFSNLAAYSAYNSAIKEIRYENFENLFKLQKLVLENNKISHIPKDAFKNLNYLKYLLMDIGRLMIKFLKIWEIYENLI
ncbi:unnamed protein product [Chironomus riparius]|uniref:Uncharacterized protein n=1 Tax=Chironomus riparius TaxID=315576 RepID=A0A9N9WUK0_9DIPT|nr:unnamed protein product [Chironomus riparius]